MLEGDTELKQIVEYMKAHWPSRVKAEWQVSLDEYAPILGKVLEEFTVNKTRECKMVRIAGLSGSGKTTQLLPAVEGYFEARNLVPILVAARRFAPYHPYYQEIADFYGEENVRKMTDEFSTIMMFLVLAELTKEGFDIILDVTLLDPAVEGVLMKFLGRVKYEYMITMIAASPEITEKHLAGRTWRHSKETELEFIRATGLALEFYAKMMPEARIVLWNTYEAEPVFDGKVRESLEIFDKYSKIVDAPEHDEDVLRAAKIKYLAD